MEYYKLYVHFIYIMMIWYNYIVFSNFYLNDC